MRLGMMTTLMRMMRKVRKRPVLRMWVLMVRMAVTTKIMIRMLLLATMKPRGATTRVDMATVISNRTRTRM